MSIPTPRTAPGRPAPRRAAALLFLLALAVMPVRALAVPVTGPRPPAAAASGEAVPALPSDEALRGEVDALLAPLFPADGPGAAVLVSRHGKTILSRGYGLASVELNVPVRPDMVFRLGSVTKQFTAAAILLLQERGALSVADDITKFLPDYPVQGHRVTIEHLLTHTSGIQSYTDLPEWPGMMRRDLSLAELIDVFKDKPFVFAPGEKWEYCNSGYVLLGAIIEKAGGVTYEEFLERNIFEPLGMSRTGYGHVGPVIPGRVAGYSGTGQELVNADYLSMTQPHAAGALVSTVEDLARWDAALRPGGLLKDASLEAFFKPARLNNGESTGYAFGWAVGEFEGHPWQQHGGGINGFTTAVLRMPGDGVYVTVLANCDALKISPDFLALKIAAAAIGRAMPRPGQFTMKPERLEEFTGVYEVDSTSTRMVTREGDRLYSQRSGSRKLEIFPVNDSTFAFLDRQGSIIFRRDAAGQVWGMLMTTGPNPTWSPRTSREVEAGPQAIAVDPALYDRYAGRYQLAPGIVMTVTREGDQLMTQLTGQGKIEIFPLSETTFFPKVVDARLEFRLDGEGRASTLILRQAGREMPMSRIP